MMIKDAMPIYMVCIYAGCYDSVLSCGWFIRPSALIGVRYVQKKGESQEFYICQVFGKMHINR